MKTSRMVRVCVLAFSAMVAGPAWAEVAHANFDCAYLQNGVLETFERCAWSDASGRFQMKRKHRLALSFDRYGLASVGIAGGLYYMRRYGRLAPVMNFDNWAEPFANGLARSPVGGKIGFINRNLALAIPARYDGAYPFQRGWAAVCIDCKLTFRGEHSRYEGGRWGCIDRHGREREPFRPAGPPATSVAMTADHAC